MTSSLVLVDDAFIGIRSMLAQQNGHAAAFSASFASMAPNYILDVVRTMERRLALWLRRFSAYFAFLAEG